MILEQVASIDSYRQYRIALQVCVLPIRVGRNTYVANKRKRKTTKVMFPYGGAWRQGFPYIIRVFARVVLRVIVDLSQNKCFTTGQWRLAIRLSGQPVWRVGQVPPVWAYNPTREDIRALVANLVDVIVQMDRKRVTEIYFLPEAGPSC